MFPDPLLLQSLLSFVLLVNYVTAYLCHVTQNMTSNHRTLSTYATVRAQGTNSCSALCWALAIVILYTVGRIPWMGD
jgi:hypothetical protein